MLPGSAFMPPELVEWSFEQLVVTFPENAYNLGGNYIKKQTLNGQMNAPLYQISLWNNYHQVPQGLLRTTNFVEAWHRGFQTTCGCHHSKFEKSLITLKQSKVTLS